MPKERWAHAAEIESNPKTPLHPSEINAESYELPVLTVDIGETDTEDQLPNLVEEYMKKNKNLKNAIDKENLDVVAKENKGKNGKKNWALIIGVGFAALAVGVAGYKLIKKYQKPKN
ncbi:hypothetical protein A2572_04110 [Candidatus Collierbacteria bacterium RIFOXYD1_FULL_40_9]|uniref:Uncharacterized protein n=1 Tax=Candidatus Collierbacteria bacterium RIFOXYD1_FULL_40_9 TaxID=1817731 RepID=A0A1F5FPR8_9BACT|nr:MAG: hypothetical protein A2572_04110 [Candidatus Collierbacteria bacterium RIFOXYD1_FULL_40_9]